MKLWFSIATISLRLMTSFLPFTYKEKKPYSSGGWFKTNKDLFTPGSKSLHVHKLWLKQARIYQIGRQQQITVCLKPKMEAKHFLVKGAEREQKPKALCDCGDIKKACAALLGGEMISPYLPVCLLLANGSPQCFCWHKFEKGVCWEVRKGINSTCYRSPALSATPFCPQKCLLPIPSPLLCPCH